MRRYLIAIAMLLLSLSATAFAQDYSLTPFRKFFDVAGISVNVPTVIEVPLQKAKFDRTDFAVLNTETKTFEPWLLMQQIEPSRYRVSAQDTEGANMFDGDANTYTQFDVPINGTSTAEIALTSTTPVTSTELTFLLDRYVALPLTIQIEVLEPEGKKIVVAEKKMDATTVRFPKTTATSWFVTLKHAQPLRIGEIRLVDENLKDSTRAIRFLAQPGNTYQIYFDSDRPVQIPTPEAPNLRLDDDVKKVSEPDAKDNPNYVIADTDADTVADILDNCVQVANSDQLDVNTNGRGDACDDFDKDGMINSIDNCQTIPNRAQTDTDADGIGDECDDEESRITEKYDWVPWVGMGGAAVVLLGLIIVTIMKPRPPSGGEREIR